MWKNTWSGQIWSCIAVSDAKLKCEISLNNVSKTYSYNILTGKLLNSKGDNIGTYRDPNIINWSNGNTWNKQGLISYYLICKKIVQLNCTICSNSSIFQFIFRLKLSILLAALDLDTERCHEYAGIHGAGVFCNGTVDKKIDYLITFDPVFRKKRHGMSSEISYKDACTHTCNLLDSTSL